MGEPPSHSGDNITTTYPVRKNDHVVFWRHELSHTAVRGDAQVVCDFEYHAGVC